MTEFPSRSRLLLFAVLLPAAVAGTNQLLFEVIEAFSWSLRPWLLYPWMASTTAALSWCVGRYLCPAWFRWIIFGWCLVLLDLLTIAACLSGPLPSHFAYILVSAQVGLLVLWSVLADVRWQWRLPGAAVAAPVIAVFASNWAGAVEDFGLLTVLAAVVLVLVCGVLRWRGFVLQHVDCQPDANHPDSIHSHQFGIKHLLVWATAAAPLLLAARGLDFLMFVSLDRPSAFPAVVVALAFAAVTLVAIWTVLGTGLWPLRIAALLLVPVLLGFGLDRYGAYLRPPPNVPWTWSPILYTLWHMESNWIVWLWLNAVLLAALLLFLRASGYRLMRRSRPSSR